MNTLNIYNLDDLYCETSMKKVELSEGSILATSSILDWVKEGGFDFISYIEKTSYERPYIKVDGNTYVLIKEIKGKKLNVKKKEDVLKAIRCIGRFHLSGEGCLPKSGIKIEASWGRCMEKYKTYTCTLEKYIDLLESRGCKNSFEEKTYKYLDDLYKMAKKSIEFFRSDRYIDAIEKSMRKREICINDLGYNSIVFSSVDKNPYINKIFSMGYNMCEEDVAAISRKYIEETGDGEFINEIIAEYKKIRDIDEVSVENIKSLALFPEMPIKMISKYMKKGEYKENVLNKFLSMAHVFKGE